MRKRKVFGEKGVQKEECGSEIKGELKSVCVCVRLKERARENEREREISYPMNCKE